MQTSPQRWSHESFSGAEFGDARRSRRFVRLMERVAGRPSGRITQVFSVGAERQAAYDFVEHDAIGSSLVIEAIGNACARDCAGQETVLIALDGTSLNLTDEQQRKGFGSIGARNMGGNGLKVMNTLAMQMDGTPMGVPTQRYWARGERVQEFRYRPIHARESAHFRHAVDEVAARFVQHAPRTRLHFVADREADGSELIRHLLKAGHDFTIRANGTRKIVRGNRWVAMQPSLRQMKPIGDVWLHIPARANCPAREARLWLRVARVCLVVRDRQKRNPALVTLSVVWAREQDQPPSGYKRVDWLLYTTTTVTSLRDAFSVLQRYSFRWRIEELHRTWKSGTCRVEDMQLRSREAAIKWASMLSAVAARVETLKHLSRTEPDQPASTELSDDEIRVLIILKREIKKRTEEISDDMPTVAQAVRWIADLGGYVAIKGNGPPGSVVLSRGLERLTWAVAGAQALSKMR